MQVLVIGGAGFLGRHIVEKFLENGYRVSVFDIRSTFKDERVKFHIGDLNNKEELLSALLGVDSVIHCATPSPLSNNRQVFEKVNCEGTKLLIEACKERNVRKLILTSSASVVYEGRDIKGGNEDLPYAKKPMDYYTLTKIQQEKIVLEANSPTLSTVALRPHGIFGPRDPHMLPTIARLSQAGKTKYIIGNGKNLVDFTYVENVAQAHLLAIELMGPLSNINGKAYNVTNDEPVLFWDFMGKLTTGLGYPAPRVKLPYFLVYLVALLIQFFAWLFRPIKTIKPTFTPMTVALSGTHHHYSCEKAKAELKYKPLHTLDAGILKTLESFTDLKKKDKTQ